MADIAIFRINYKSDFILTINGDAGWSVPFCIKFWTGTPSQGYFVGYNGSTYTNCRIGDEPTKLVVLFDDHHLPIGEMKMQIAYHTTIEEFPGSVYDEVTNARDVIVDVEDTEYQVMLDVNGETAPEIEFNLPAYANEAQRIANEQERQREFAKMQEENAQAVEGAENVNAELSGTVLTVTNRNGIQHTSDVQGQPGAPGIGVPAGGSTGQVLAKKSDNNYDTEWVNQQGGGGSSQADWAQNDQSAPDYIKNKPSVYTQQQTDEAIKQAKKDVSWEANEYYVLGTGNSASGIVDNPKGRVVYYSSARVAFIRIFSLPHITSTGISFKVIGTPIEDTDNFVRIVVAGNEIIFRTSNRPTIFKAGVTYEVEYTYISHNNLSCVYLESWSGGTSTAAYTGSYNDLKDKPNIPTVPTNVSDFVNDAGYITKSVNDLVNYYLKSETYTKQEVQALVNAIKQFTYQVVTMLPEASASTMNIIYLVPSADPQTQNVKDEYITIENSGSYSWEQIGSTAIDLSGYYTAQQTDSAISQALTTALADYTTTAALTLLLAGKQDVINDLSDIRSGAAAGATAYQKPQGGIPKSDLAQGVQDSLDLADTALQEDTLYVKVNNNGHEYVDLGLPSGTLWAKCNVGADDETGYGNYYMYGKGARQYNSSDSPYTGTEDPLDLSVDTARQVLGGSWKMPTQVQMQELIDNTTYEFTTINGVNGAKFTAQNGNYVFIPAAGYWDIGGQENVGSSGNYWSSTPDDSDNAYNLLIRSGFKLMGIGFRNGGLSVRGVILPDTTQLKQDLDSKADKVPNATNGNFAGLDANGNLTDSGSKASDFATTQQLPTTMGASGSGHKGGLVPDTPSTAGTTKFLCEDGTWKAVDMSGKEDVTTIVTPVNETDATLPVTSLACEVGKYYRIDVPVETLGVTLPAITDNTTVRTVVLYLTTGTTPAITFSSTAPVYYHDGFELEAGKTYEVNALYNGAAWVIASVEIVVSANNGE